MSCCTMYISDRDVYAVYAGSELQKLGALKLFISELTESQTSGELTASFCVLTLANMASYSGLGLDIVQLNAVNGLVTLLDKAQ